MGPQQATSRDAAALTAAPPSRRSGRSCVHPVAGLFLRVQRSAGNGAATALAAGAYGRKAPADETTAAGELADAVRQLAADWDALATPEARARRLVDAANDRLRELGVPAVDASLEQPPDQGPLQTNRGVFTPKDWTIHLSPRFFSEPPDPKSLADLGGTVAHEARHTEQWWAMARYLAGTTRDLAADEIARQTGIEAGIAHRARADRLRDGDAGYEQAKAWYESVYGAGAAHRAEVLDSLQAALVDLNYKKKQAADSPGDAAARLALRAAQLEYRKWYDEWSRLPTEADAERVGDLARDALTEGPPGP